MKALDTDSAAFLRTFDVKGTIGRAIRATNNSLLSNKTRDAHEARWALDQVMDYVEAGGPLTRSQASAVECMLVILTTGVEGR